VVIAYAGSQPLQDGKPFSYPRHPITRTTRFVERELASYILLKVMLVSYFFSNENSYQMF
jgi:hypothetical protein